MPKAKFVAEYNTDVSQLIIAREREDKTLEILRVFKNDIARDIYQLMTGGNANDRID